MYINVVLFKFIIEIKQICEPTLNLDINNFIWCGVMVLAI